MLSSPQESPATILNPKNRSNKCPVPNGSHIRFVGDLKLEILSVLPPEDSEMALFGAGRLGKLKGLVSKLLLENSQGCIIHTLEGIFTSPASADMLDLHILLRDSMAGC